MTLFQRARILFFFYTSSSIATLSTCAQSAFNMHALTLSIVCAQRSVASTTWHAAAIISQKCYYVFRGQQIGEHAFNLLIKQNKKHRHTFTTLLRRSLQLLRKSSASVEQCMLRTAEVV
jgi:hypothetical protein